MLLVATDGACKRNPGPAGWAWYADDDMWQAGAIPGQSTNNVGELTAILFALRAFPTTPLELLVDSKYAIQAVSRGPGGWVDAWEKRGWKNTKGDPVANRDLIELIVAELDYRSAATVFTWVRGHAGHPLNSAADRLAVGASNFAVTAAGPVSFHPGRCLDHHLCGSETVARAWLGKRPTSTST